MGAKRAVPYIHRHPKTAASPIREPSSARRPQSMNMMWWSPRLARRRRLAPGATIIMTETTSPAYAGLAVAELIQSGHGADDAIERAPDVYESRGIGNSYLRWPTFASCCRPKRRPYLPWNVNASSGNAAPPTSSARSG